VFKIEKNIPIPLSTREHKYPFDDMEIGDSFLAHWKTKNLTKKEKNNMVTSIKGASRAVRLKGKKFCTRCNGKGVRCWRTK